jgi:hypothetical protein
MLACAGFDVFNREEYYIPRSYIQVPDTWINKIFPFLELWKEQVNNDYRYDNGLAARNFVNHLLPFLATIILQDGIYFTSAFPNHPYTLLLLHKLQGEGYEEWCTLMRDSLAEKEVILQQNREEDEKYVALLRTAEKSIQSMQSVESRLYELTRVLFSSAVAPHISVSTDDVHITVDSGMHSFRSALTEPRISGNARQQIIAMLTQSNRETTVPVKPVIPVCLHKTIVENMEYWIEKQLWMYTDRGNVSLRQLGWDGKTQFRFCKRRDIALWVRTVAENVLRTSLDWFDNSDILLQTASILDEERGSDTVLTAVQKFKQLSSISWMKKRKKKQEIKNKNDDTTQSENSDFSTQRENSDLSVEVVCLNTEEYYDTD